MCPDDYRSSPSSSFSFFFSLLKFELAILPKPDCNLIKDSLPAFLGRNGKNRYRQRPLSPFFVSPSLAKMRGEQGSHPQHSTPSLVTVPASGLRLAFPQAPISEKNLTRSVGTGCCCSYESESEQNARRLSGASRDNTASKNSVVCNQTT